MLHISLFKKLPKHLIRKILQYTTALRPKYLDAGFFRIPITKQWCIVCGEKVQRHLNPSRALKCSECWNVMCRAHTLQFTCCNSRHKVLCLI